MRPDSGLRRNDGCEIWQRCPLTAARLPFAAGRRKMAQLAAGIRTTGNKTTTHSDFEVNRSWQKRKALWMEYA